MALDVGEIAGAVLQRVRATAARVRAAVGEAAGSGTQEAGAGEAAMAELDEREDVIAEEEEGRDGAGDGEEEEEEGQGEERASRRRVRAAVLDAGRPAAPASWRGLPAVELIAQGIAETDRKRGRR